MPNQHNARKKRKTSAPSHLQDYETQFGPNGKGQNRVDNSTKVKEQRRLKKHKSTACSQSFFSKERKPHIHFVANG